jgi:hypothetical protein
MKTIATLLFSMQAAHVLAAPVIERNPILSARQNANLIGPVDGGYAVVEYGNGRLNYGARVPSTILDVIRDECGDTGCNPAGGLGFSTLVVNSDRGNDQSYTINVEGTFNLEGERGSKAQLLDLAKMAFQEVYNAGVATRRQGVIYITGECPPSRTHGCFSECRMTSQRISIVSSFANTSL